MQTLEPGDYAHKININHTFVLKIWAGEMAQYVQALVNDLGSNICNVHSARKGQTPVSCFLISAHM